MTATSSRHQREPCCRRECCAYTLKHGMQHVAKQSADIQLQSSVHLTSHPWPPPHPSNSGPGPVAVDQGSRPPARPAAAAAQWCHPVPPPRLTDPAPVSDTGVAHRLLQEAGLVRQAGTHQQAWLPTVRVCGQGAVQRISVWQQARWQSQFQHIFNTSSRCLIGWAGQRCLIPIPSAITKRQQVCHSATPTPSSLQPPASCPPTPQALPCTMLLPLRSPPLLLHQPPLLPAHSSSRSAPRPLHSLTPPPTYTHPPSPPGPHLQLLGAPYGGCQL